MAVDQDLLRGAGMRTFEEDALERPDAYGQWFAPTELKLEPGYLCWRPEPGDPVTARRPLLDQFLLLDGQDDDHVLRFARRWGVLNMCTHGVPAAHFPMRLARFLDGDEAPCGARPRRGLDGWVREPLAAWRTYSRQAGALLAIAAELRMARARPVPPERWSPLADLVWPVDLMALVGGIVVNDGASPIELTLADVPSQRRVLAIVMRSWFELGDVEVSFEWEPDPRIRLGNGNLFGAVAVQLALAVSSSGGMVVCSECGRIYSPRRQPSPGRPPRCPRPECRKAANREYMRRRRASQRAASASSEG